MVERNSRRLMRLVSDLLFVAQVEAGKLALEAGEASLAEIARESVEAAKPIAEEKLVTLTVRCDRLPACAGDRDRLGQAFDNLVSNALKFTPAGGRVEVRVRRDGDRARIEVEDTGAGIPADEQARLFERFFRASSAVDGAVPGVGLGLTIVKAIVEAHGGRIGVASRVGAGTTFSIELPLHPARAALVGPPRAAEEMAL